MQNQSVEGSLHIRLASEPGDVAIHSSRPLAAARVFEGRSIDETLRLLPLLYNVCGQAQATAAVRAIESARGMSANNSVELARERLVELETLREHLWRALLDWPRFYGEAPTMQNLGALMTAIQGYRDNIDPDHSLCARLDASLSDGALDAARKTPLQLQRAIEKRVFDANIESWLDYDIEQFDYWLKHADTEAARLLRFVRRRGWAEIGDGDCRPLPALSNDELSARLDRDDADDFVAAPTLANGPYETGTLARQREQALLKTLRELSGHGLFTRLVARLVEIARILTSPGSTATSLYAAQPGSGVAQLEAARGRLCHRVVLHDERIARYQIVAPTEWNFAPDGPAVTALRGIASASGPIVRAQAELLIQAIDPCVGFELEMVGS